MRGWTIGFVMFIVLGIVGQSKATEPFVITTPPADSTFALGQDVTIEWTGGDPSWLVDVSLIDVFNWTVAETVATGTPNTHAIDWTFPIDHPLDGPSERMYVFYVQYIEDGAHVDWTYGPLFTIVRENPIAIDIKPDSDSNPINLKSKGLLPVAILTTEDFSPLLVDDETILFGDEGALSATAGDPVTPTKIKEDDVDGDGDLDLLLFFSVNALVECGAIDEESTSIGLTAELLDGTPIIGSDSVRIVPRHN